MVKQNQGFRKDLNFEETTNDTLAINNLAGVGIANDLRIIQNNLRNISTVSFNSLDNGFFFFGDSNEFVFTNDDVVGVSTDVTVGSGVTLFSNTDYYVCSSDAETKFKLSSTPSSIGINTVGVTTVSPTNFLFIRKDPVYQENILNFVRPDITDTENFSYFGGSNLNDIFISTLDANESARFEITRKYKTNKDTSTTSDIKVEGSIIINDPAKLNTNDTGLSSSKSPGIFIGTTRAFSSDNNPWTQVGTALSTSSSLVSIGELYFADNITITGISTESASEVAVTSFTHKLPVIINGETYYLLLRT